MIHPHTEIKFISEHVGYGVVATRFIPQGTITWVLDELDREFTPEQVLGFDQPVQDILDIYCFRNKVGNYVLCWDHGRFVNHSFNSNCLSTAYDFEIAIRDIEVGEQLTDDYGYLNINQPFRGLDEGTKRKIVYPDDLLKYHKKWDKQIEKAFPKITKVTQPLRPIIKTDMWDKIVNINSGSLDIESILSNYYPSTNGH